MAFFDDLGKKLTQAGQAVSQKTKDITEVAKLNAAISDEEKKLHNSYYQIGRLYFSKHSEDCESDFAGLIISVQESEKKVLTLRQQIQDIKGVTRCEKCGSEIPTNISFCSSCGAPVPPKAAPINPNLIRCTGCGQMISKNLKFCTVCGTATSFASEPVAAPAPAPFTPAPAVEPAPIQEPVTVPTPDPVADPDATVSVHSAKRCVACGASIPDGMAFCQECGTKVQ